MEFLIVVMLLLVVAIDVLAIIHIAKNKDLKSNEKLNLYVIICCLPFLGAFLYYPFARQRAKSNRAYRKLSAA